MESKLEKHTHILGRAKGELSGHRKMGISRDTHFLERSEVRWLRPGQGTERKKTSKGHSLSRESRGWNWSEHGKQTSQQGKLTAWRGQRLGLVRTWKENKPARDTHLLERAEVRTYQEIKTKKASKEHLQTGKDRG